MEKSLLILFLLFTVLMTSQTKFVRSEDSKHVVLSISRNHIQFDGRDYYMDMDNKRDWFKWKDDSITWVWGHNIRDWKDVVKVGFYNNRRNYVISTKTEKLKN